jgi:hypothetical protein
MWTHLGLLALVLPQGSRTAPLALERREDLEFLLETIASTHPDPHARNTREEWESAVARARASAEGASDSEHFFDLARIVALLRDGHSALVPSPASLGSRCYPIDFEFFDDGLYVAAADPQYGQAVGKRVSALRGRAVQDVLAAARPAVSADNEQGARAIFELVLGFPCFHQVLAGADAPWTMAVEDENGKLATVELVEPEPGPPWFLAGRPADWATADPAALPLWRGRADQPYWFEELDGKDGNPRRTLYMRYARVEHASDERFPAFCRRMFERLEKSAVERLVIDLRGNRGGNNYITQSLIHGVIRSGLDRPGGVYVLTDHATFSAAMNCASYLERDTWALFAGAPTGASPNHFGDAEQFPLPHSGHLLLCSTVRWQDSDPRDERPWIYPDLPVQTTFADFQAGKDPVLEAVLAHEPSPIEGYTDVLPRAHWQRATQSATTWPPREGGR